MDNTPHFMCTAQIAHYDLDTCNRQRVHHRALVLSAPTEAALYEQIAQAKIRHTTQTDDDYFDWERETISFGPILTIAATSPLNQDRLEASSTWQAHQAELEAKRLAAEAEARQDAEQAAEMERTQAAAQEAAELAIYERIKSRLQAGHSLAAAEQDFLT